MAFNDNNSGRLQFSVLSAYLAKSEKYAQELLDLLGLMRKKLAFYSLSVSTGTHEARAVLIRNEIKAWPELLKRKMEEIQTEISREKKLIPESFSPELKSYADLVESEVGQMLGEKGRRSDLDALAQTIKRIQEEPRSKELIRESLSCLETLNAAVQLMINNLQIEEHVLVLEREILQQVEMNSLLRENREHLRELVENTVKTKLSILREKHLTFKYTTLKQATAKLWARTIALKANEKIQPAEQVVLLVTFILDTIAELQAWEVQISYDAHKQKWGCIFGESKGLTFERRAEREYSSFEEMEKGLRLLLLRLEAITEKMKIA